MAEKVRRYTLKQPVKPARVYRVKYEDELNSEQLEVVMAGDGPMLVIAGAGSGKTRALHTPVYTVVLGTPNGTIERTLVGGFREVTRVPANPRALDSVARVSGGKFFAAADPEELKRVYEELGSQLGTRDEEREITDYFSAG